jgi:hypothetical protein
MKDKKNSELDCSKKCKHVIRDCEAGGSPSEQCVVLHNQCVSKCPFA